MSRIRFHVATVITLATGLAQGCGTALVLPAPTPLFTTPITVNGEPVGSAIIDTGGGYDLMLKDQHGLAVIKKLDVLIFDGISTVEITEPFSYTAGGFEARAGAALIGVNLCDCNGIGYFFMRKTGAVLGLDFERASASFGMAIPARVISMPFAPPPANMAGFNTSFLEVLLSDGAGRSLTVTALIDTGAAATLMRRGLIGKAPLFVGNRTHVLITRGELGTVSANVGLFDTPGLPDLLIGLDVMRAWSHNWLFSYDDNGGMIHVVPRPISSPPNEITGNVLPIAKGSPYRMIP